MNSPSAPRPITRLALVAAICFGVCQASVAAGPRNRVIAVGSSTVFPFASAVAEVFGKKGPFKTPTVESIGTGAGFKLFCRGKGVDTADINEASRPMTDAERELCEKNDVYGVLGIQFGFEGIVIANSTRGAAFELTSEQLYRALAKRVAINGRMLDNPYRRWIDVDPRLPNQPISVLGPAPNHGTRDAFTALILAPPCRRIATIRALAPEEQTLACQSVREDGGWIDVAGDYGLLIAKLRNDPNSVAVLPYSYLDQNRDAIQAARIDGIAPTPQTISTFRYRAARPLFIYVKTSHLRVVPGLAEFVAEFVSERAAGKDGYLAAKGLIPMPAGWLAGERAKVTRWLTPSAPAASEPQ